MNNEKDIIEDAKIWSFAHEYYCDAYVGEDAPFNDSMPSPDLLCKIIENGASIVHKLLQKCVEWVPISIDPPHDIDVLAKWKNGRVMVGNFNKEMPMRECGWLFPLPKPTGLPEFWSHIPE